MDIRNWALDQIMQLPDSCFGRRFSVCAYGISVDASPAWDIAELAFPERFVLWELVISYDHSVMENIFSSVRLALGDQLPTVAAMFNVLQPLIPGLGIQGPEPRIMAGLTAYFALHMRNPIEANGRRLVIEVVSAVEKTVNLSVVCQVSSIPREVPDCLVSV